ncbi:hypothetical protein Q7P37_010973 [Cladosporium fusiforme]
MLLSAAMPSYLALLLALPAAITASNLDCEHIRVDKQDFNLSPLGGPKTVHLQEYDPPSIANTTFTIDICKKLTRDPEIPNEKQCPSGTQVCGVEEVYGRDGTHITTKVQPIAGEFIVSHGRALDPRWTRLKGSASNEDAEREGLRLELNGGKYPENKEGVPHKAIVEFLCDAELTGNEGFGDAKEKRVVRRAEGEGEKEGEGEPDDEITLPDLDKGKSMEFLSFKPEGEEKTKVLRLRWKTKYACENAEAPPAAPKKSNSWGFFTWFLIIVFLLAASYIIFGSWLNYNRYGARGWDLIPHGDTIRDLPYIVKDFGSSVAGRIQVGGGDSRGGYSAV